MCEKLKHDISDIVDGVQDEVEGTSNTENATLKQHLNADSITVLMMQNKRITRNIYAREECAGQLQFH